ncbi:MAG: hypothetical protein KatS3mg015_0734 [Fimbriimonadales bacterium]|nr:MAG: hypothetical protein KatS3mg015_0734 [Fimbriimonadales bacterium]
MGRPINVQDTFLNQVRKEEVPVTIYVMGGVKLTGIVRGFDAFTVLLESPGRPAELVYKHAICAILPAKELPNSGLAVVREKSPEVTEPQA